jgi:hypothetical protein
MWRLAPFGGAGAIRDHQSIRTVRRRSRRPFRRPGACAKSGTHEDLRFGGPARSCVRRKRQQLGALARAGGGRWGHRREHVELGRRPGDRRQVGVQPRSRNLSLLWQRHVQCGPRLCVESLREAEHRQRWGKRRRECIDCGRRRLGCRGSGHRGPSTQRRFDLDGGGSVHGRGIVGGRRVHGRLAVDGGCSRNGRWGERWCWRRRAMRARGIRMQQRSECLLSRHDVRLRSSVARQFYLRPSLSELDPVRERLLRSAYERRCLRLRAAPVLPEHL